MSLEVNNDSQPPHINGDSHEHLPAIVDDSDEHLKLVNGGDGGDKIDIDAAQPESDTRHEPLKAQEDASNDGDNSILNHTNGIASPAETPMTTPAPSATDTIFTTPALDDDMQPPPAKRPRVHSDADKASLANSATPPPASVAASNAPTPVPTLPAFDVRQWKFCQSTIRTLKKLKDAGAFLRPVDPVALNIPHYFTVIKNPMDFSTIERKLNSSNPSKPDPNPENPRYFSPDDFISDVRLIFNNCITFNGPDHFISQSGKRVEEVFDKQIKQLPPLEASVVKKSHSPPPATSLSAKKAQPARRASTSVPVIRRSDNEPVGRPKREIHPPPPKDLPYADVPKKMRKSKRVKDDLTSEQLKFCGKLLQEMHRKQHYSMASPFYEPVDWVKYDLPTYPKIVKKPMDLQTMRQKLDRHEYPNAEKFFEDFKLMIRNCFNFNPAGTVVNQAGIELQRFFDERWKSLPTIHQISRDMSDDDEDDEDDQDEEERARAIAAMESQIETMKGNLAALKSNKPPKKKKEKRDRSSMGTGKAPGQQTKSSKKKAKKQEDDIFTFDQKKDLSDAIGQLEGPKLEKVIQIIHEGVPEIRDSTEEIELEIDQLPPKVLTKLYNFVIRPLRPGPTKRSRPGKGGGTGGLKRKSMDEDAEAEKIRQLEQRMKLFEQGPSYQPPHGAGSDHSSDSSSGSDSSGSESD